MKRAIGISITLGAFLFLSLSPVGSAQPVCNVTPTSLNFGNVCVGSSANQTFTVSNTGNSSFTINGFNSSNPAFTVLTPLPIIVSPGGSVIVTVRLNCPSPGAQSGTISIVTNPPSLCSTVNVSGSCVQPSTCMVSPTTLNFGSVCVGSSANQSFTVTNTGGPVTINAINSSNPAFTIVSPALPITVAGGVLMVTVRMSCSSPGAQSGTLTFSTSSACGSVSCSPVSVSGTCVQPTCMVSPTTLNFGNVCVGSTADQTFTVSNTGNVSFTINAINSSNPAFSIVGPALPATLSPGGNVMVTVRLSCGSPGAQSGTISLTTSSACGSVSCASVNVSGVCLQAACAVSPTTLNFGTVFTGSTADQSFTVSNTGNTSFTINAINSSNPAFTIIDPALPATVPAGGSVMVTVRLSCTTAGSPSGTINLSTSSSCGSVSCSPVSVSGTCVQNLACDVNPTTLSFGNVGVGSSADRTFTMSNTGSQSFTITAINSSNPAFTVISPMLPVMVPPGGSVMVTVRLNCTTLGMQSGTLSIVTNPPDLCSTVNVSGSCTQMGCTVSPTTLDFGRVCPSTSADRTFTVSNTSSSSFTITAINSSNPAFTVIGPMLPVMVPPGGSVTVTVRLNCTTLGMQSGTLSIVTNPPDLCSTVNVTGFCGDTTPPVVTCPANMVVEPTSPAGAVVTFTTTATDNCTPNPTLSCAPPSGSLFPLGTTMVTCTAADASGNQATCTFTITVGGACDGTSIQPDVGGTVTNPETGEAIDIPPYTLKTEALVKVLPLDSPCPFDNSCGVPIQPGEPLPEVRGFTQATQAVRFEGQPCINIFGPGARITLRLLSSRFPNGLPIGTPLRLFELARAGGQLVFLDTGIDAKVTGSGRSSGRGDFVTVPDIQVFSTFAGFMSARRLSPLLPDQGKPATEAQPLTVAQQSGQHLHFPVIHQLSDRQTRIFVTNPDPAAPLTITVTAYNDGGTAIDTRSLALPGNSRAFYFVSRLFPGFTSGAIIHERQSGTMTGYYEIIGEQVLGGAEGIERGRSALVFPVIKQGSGGFTEIHVFNPNTSQVSLRLAGFTASGSRVTPTNSSGQPLDILTLPRFAKLVVASTESPNTANVRLPFSSLDGGYVLVETTDEKAVMGGEVFGETGGGQNMLAVLNGLPFPTGCLASPTEPFSCHVDTSPESPVPSAARQHTLYAVPLENTPAESILYLVNVSDRPAPLAFSAFSELGQFRATVPATGFMTINPHQVFQMSVVELFGFNPSPGYVRVEDPNSAFVGGIINRISGRYGTAVPIIPDDPRLAQTATTTAFSRLELMSGTTTGMVILNPNNNPLGFTIKATDENGIARESPPQMVAPRGTFARVSLGVLFPNIFVRSGFAQVQVTTEPGPGMGGHVIPVAVYRSGTVVSTVPPQNKQP